MVIQNITEPEISQATCASTDTSDWFGVSGVFKPQSELLNVKHELMIKN
jgi:hypothetical protein